MSSGYVRTETPALPYCKGCGHALVLRALGEAFESLKLPPADLAVVTDIGCVGLADVNITTPHTVHTTHGRSTAFASGISLADSVLGAGRLKTVVMIGDGGAMIGINHLINGALMNPDVTVIVHNNFLFGMTGGQNSAFSPVDFVTTTTKEGSFLPPLDLARVLMAARGPFVARLAAGDRELAAVIARAIAHPGFAVVEVLELCTAYGTRWNALTGSKMAEIARDAGYEMGVLCDKPRPTFAAAWRERHARAGERENSDALSKPIEGAALAAGSAGAAAPPATREEASRDGTPAPTPAGGAFSRHAHGFTHHLEGPRGLVLAGTAGERVQTAATLLARAGLLCGLHVTQKNDNPVTQGTGFSVSEVILSPEPILYTGIERPDGVLVISQDGCRELQRAGVFSRETGATTVLADEEVQLPALAAAVRRFPFRKKAGGKLAALAAVAAWLGKDGPVPAEAFRAAIEARYGAAEAARTREALAPFE